MPQNPCLIARTYRAKGISNQYDITIQIDAKAWNDCAEQDMVISILNNTPIPILVNLRDKGNGIKRESNGWTIHT